MRVERAATCSPPRRCREAANGTDFIAAAERICRRQGRRPLRRARRRELTALGVVSGFHQPDGIVGDLGGGSSNWSTSSGTRIGAGVTLPLGGLALQDASEKSIKKAEKIVAEALADVAGCCKGGEGAPFYAIGGTWRSLARLHMRADGLSAARHARLRRSAPSEALDFCAPGARGVDTETLSQIEVVSRARRPLLPMRRWCSSRSSAHASRRDDRDLGARRARGPALFDCSTPRSSKQRPADRRPREELNVLRSRSPRHGEELIAWTDALHGVDRARRDRRGEAAAPRRLPARRHRLARASGLSRRAVAQPHRPMPPSSASTIPAAPIWRSRSSSATTACSTRSCRRASASSPRPACSTAPACSARRCASPI